MFVGTDGWVESVGTMKRPRRGIWVLSHVLKSGLCLMWLLGFVCGTSRTTFSMDEALTSPSLYPYTVATAKRSRFSV